MYFKVSENVFYLIKRISCCFFALQKLDEQLRVEKNLSKCLRFTHLFNFQQIFIFL